MGIPTQTRRAHKEDAPDKFELAAGDYAVEVTTTARATGTFTIAVSAVDAEQPEPATVSGLEASYDATVDAPFSVGFNYQPDDAQVSVSVSPSGFSLQESDRSGLFAGSAGLAGTPRHADTYTVTLELTQPGRVDRHTFTVVASCAQDHTQQSDRSCVAPVCTAPLGGGSVGSGVLEGSGSWESGCVLPAGRRSGNGTYYAKHYTFTLTDTARVTIDLTSDENTYLFLLSGHGPDGAKLRHDDDDGDGYDSRLSDVSLTAGDYTITATTYGRERTGSFEVQLQAYIPLVVTGLDESYDGTFGEMWSFGFTYEPAAAVVSVKSVSPPGPTLNSYAHSGFAGLADIPTHTGTHTVTLAFTQHDRVDERMFTITVTCPTDHTEQADGSCEVPARPVCTQHLGRVNSGTLGPEEGVWEEGCALPTGRRAGGGVYYAKHYTFSLNMRAFVTIDLTSSDQNTYVYLLRGHGPDGTFVRADNDSGDGTNSKLTDIDLAAGDYTISATTLIRERTGDFELTVRAVAPATTNLQSDFDAVVGQSLLVGFRVSPAGVAVPDLGTITTTGLGVELLRANYIELDGDSSLKLTSRRTGEWSFNLKLIQPGRTDTHPITVTAVCPTDETALPNGTCLAGGSRPTIPTNCIEDLRTGAYSKWGRFTARGQWTANCASTQMATSAARYYRLDVGTPGRFAGGVLPIKIELTATPSASMFLLEGSDPARATLLHFGSPASQTIVSGNTYDLPPGTYLFEVATSQAFDPGASNNFSLAAQLPSGSEQLRDVQLLGNTGLDGDGLRLAEFVSRHPDITTGSVPAADSPYLDWRHDACRGVQHTYPNTSDFPYGRPEPLARFGSACIRHDFNWQNLRRIERDVDPGIDTWNATAKNEADRRLSADLHVVCWNAIGLETRPHPTDHFQREMAALRSCQGKTLKVMTVVTTINNPGF